jgi:ParB family chromosome partitioning protein
MAKKFKRTDMGRGIGALLSNIDKGTQEPQKVVKETANIIALVPVNQIDVNPFQPRNEFDEEALNELAESLKVHGLIQPITVRRLNNSSFQLISGERRWRASKIAGLEEIPAYIRVVENDQEMLEMAIVENVQREQLNPVEVAISYQRLIDECDLTHEQVSDRVGKSRASVSNFLRILKLPVNVQTAIKEKQISFGHAKLLAGVEDILKLNIFFKRTVDLNLSVRALENMIKNANKPKEKSVSKGSLSADYQRVQNQLRSYLEAKVEIKLKDEKKGQGSIVIHFDSNDTLNDLLDKIED